MIDVFVSDDYTRQVQPDLLERAAAASLAHESLPPESDLSIVVEGDEKLQELNLQFLGIDAPTDVLSFPSGDIDPETEHVYLGDIIISYQRAASQAEKAGHPVENELQLLVVHGSLHLMGYDHADQEEKKRMWAVQKAILDGMGVQLARFSEDEGQ